jgi:hypothetical protein
MRTTTTAVVAALGLTVVIGTTTLAEEAPKAAPVPGGGIEASNTVTATVTVVAVDQKTRMVTVKTADGKTVKFKASPEVRNLKQVHKGDEIKLAYTESLALKLHKKGEAEPGADAAEGMARAKPGEKPAGVAARVVQITATVTAKDDANHTVTLKGPRGRTVTVKVNDAARYDKVKVGDLVEATYTEALAIAVEKPGK